LNQYQTKEDHGPLPSTSATCENFRYLAPCFSRRSRQSLEDFCAGRLVFYLPTKPAARRLPKAGTRFWWQSNGIAQWFKLGAGGKSAQENGPRRWVGIAAGMDFLVFRRDFIWQPTAPCLPDGGRARAIPLLINADCVAALPGCLPELCSYR